MKDKFENQKIIGDHVSFTHVVVRIRKNYRVTFEEQVASRFNIKTDVRGRGHAVITGCKRVFEGWVEDFVFKPTARLWVYTARLGMSNSEIYLPASGPNKPRIACCPARCTPFRHQNALPWTGADRDDARKWAQSQPRDAQGRFAKKTPPAVQPVGVGFWERP